MDPLPPKLAWQPAESALSEMLETAAGAADAEDRRSTMATLGAHQKDVQWKRIRELTENLQREKEFSVSLNTRYHDFQRDAAAQQRQMQQIVESKEQTARAQTAELEAHREAARVRENQLRDESALWQARAHASEQELAGVRKELAELLAQRAAEEEARAAMEEARAEAAAKTAREKEERENDEDALEGNERALEMVERALVRAAANLAQEADASTKHPLQPLSAERETVEQLVAAGSSGGQIAAALVGQAMGAGRALAEVATHDFARRWKEERSVRRQLQNSLQELKGSIRVMCRVRPLSSAEEAQGSEEVVQPSNDMACTVIDPAKPGARKHFGYDRVFGPSSSQGDVFEEVQPLVPSVFDGFNLCIFAYGQTGSGKTHTMQGSPDEPGLGPRLLASLFAEAEERRALASSADATSADGDKWAFSLSIGYLEVYNESVRDLLAPGGKPVVVDVRQGVGLEISIPGLTQVEVSSPAEVSEALRSGSMRRAVGATNMNAHSSRSHSLILATISGRHALTGALTTGKLYLVDLAGSERVGRSGATGERMTEAQNINRSLSALGDVMAALQTKASHVPYRNSKLTQLLSDSLGGRSKTIMLVNVSPASDSAGETLCSLNFASRVGNVELGSVKRSGGGTAAALKLSRDSEDRLRADLVEAREKAAAAERRMGEAQRALAEAERQGAEGLEEVRCERECVEFAARAEADRLSTELAQEARRRELAETAVAKHKEASTGELTALRQDLERSRAELARAQAAAASAAAAAAASGAGADERRAAPTEQDKASAVAAMRQQALAARAAATGSMGYAAGLAAPACALASVAMSSAHDLGAASMPLSLPLPLVPLPPSAVESSAVGQQAAPPKVVHFTQQPQLAPAAPLPQQAHAGLAPPAQPQPLLAQTPTRAGLAPRIAGAGTPRAAVQQLRAMPAVQALYGSDALGALDEIRQASDLLEVPRPIALWGASSHEKENAANDARSTVTGELVPRATAADGGVLRSALRPACKGGLLSSLAAQSAKLGGSCAPAPELFDGGLAANIAAATGKLVVANGSQRPAGLSHPETSYLDQTKSSTSRFTGSLSGLGGAQRVVAGKGGAPGRPASRDSEMGGRGGSGGRRMSLVARQSFAANEGVPGTRRKADGLSSLTEVIIDPAVGASNKRRRF